MRKIVFAMLGLACTFNVANAQSDKDKSSTEKSKKIYFANGDESFIFSFANVKNQGITNPRFSFYFNGGFKLLKDFSKKTALYSGLDVKNVGIAQRDSSTRERFNTYYVGIPLGLRIKTKEKNALAFGTGVDFAIYGKDKSWNVGRAGKKIKTGEWFPSTRNAVNPYAALSYKVGRIGLKGTYYFRDYFVAGYNVDPVNLFNISILVGGEESGLGKSVKWNSSSKKKTRTNI